MSYWLVPRMWEGRTIAVLASGPSMSQDVADRVRGLPTIVVNETWRLAPWADVLFASDLQWWRARREALEGFTGIRICSQPGRDISGVHRLRITGHDGYDPDRSCIRFGGNSGYQAVHVAIHTGAARVILCGFDMHTRGGVHWHGNHTGDLRNPTENRMTRWIKRFRGLNGHGAQIINCTPGSALPWFEMADLDEVVESVCA